MQTYLLKNFSCIIQKWSFLKVNFDGLIKRQGNGVMLRRKIKG